MEFARDAAGLSEQPAGFVSDFGGDAGEMGGVDMGSAEMGAGDDGG